MPDKRRIIKELSKFLDSGNLKELRQKKLIVPLSGGTSLIIYVDVKEKNVVLKLVGN